MTFATFRFVGLLAAVLTVPAAVQATPIINFSGTFADDNEVAFYTFEVTTPTAFVAQTTSYGPTGADGFDPLLTLFSGQGPSAEVLEFNDDGGCDVVASCLDAYVSRTLNAGLYTLAVTQAGNFAVGVLEDGFLYQFDPRYTGNQLYPAEDPSLPFYTADGTRRTGYWAVQITGLADSSVPEPGTCVLIGTGALVLGCIRRRSNAKSRQLHS